MPERRKKTAGSMRDGIERLFTVREGVGMIAYGFSVQGKSHIEKNIPCQDAGRRNIPSVIRILFTTPTHQAKIATYAERVGNHFIGDRTILR